MNQTAILVVGNNQLILQTVLTEINSQAGWKAVGASAGEDAIEKFHQQNVDLVILLNDITETATKKMDIIFRHQSPELIMIKQYAVDDGLLKNNIQSALMQQQKENKPAISFLDDALKNAGLNIMIQ